MFGVKAGIASSQRVLTAAPDPTTNPVIHSISHLYNTKLGYTFSWQVRNRDASSATIYSNANNSSPSTNRGTVAYNASASCSEQTGQIGPWMSIYAKAQASGKEMSSIVSFYYEP